MPRSKEFDYDEKLVAARDLFWKKGYNATSMNDLVDTMKINRSSIYITYGNKHDLFLSSLNDYIKLKDKQYHEAAARASKPLEAIKNIIYSVMDSALKDNNCLFTNSVFELAGNDKDVTKMLRKQTLRAVDQFKELLTEAKKQKSLKSDRDPHALAHYLVSGLTSIYNIHLLFSDPKLTKQTTEILIASIDV